VEEVENSDHKELSDWGVCKLILFFGGVFVFGGMRTQDWEFVCLYYGRSEEEI